jgi:hypothetical protein
MYSRPPLCAGLAAFAAAVVPAEYAGNATLAELAHHLAYSCFDARAATTLQKHSAQWLGTVDPAKSPLDAQPELVALYLTKVGLESRRDGIGPSRVLGASAAIACMFHLNGKDSPTAHPLCDVVRESSRRTLVPTPLQRDPVAAADIRSLVDAYASPGAPLRDVMHVTVFTLMYAGFLRYDDAARISVHQDLLRVQDSHIEIFLGGSKTDRHFSGSWVVIAGSGSPYCPVRLLRRLLELGRYVRVPQSDDQDVGPLLRPVGPGGTTLKQVVGTVRDPIRALSHTALLERCQQMCAAVAIRKAITLHSFRIGGATDAAAAGVPDRLFKKHGRWATESAKDRYVRECLDERLQVSRALAL